MYSYYSMFLYLVDYTKKKTKIQRFFHTQKNDIYFHEINPNTTGQIKIIEQRANENEQQNYSINKVCNSHQVVHAIFLIHTLNNI